MKTAGWRTIAIGTIGCLLFFHSAAQIVRVRTTTDFGKHDEFNQVLKEYFDKGSKCKYIDRNDVDDPFETWSDLKYLFSIERFIVTGETITARFSIFEESLQNPKLTLNITFPNLPSCNDWFSTFTDDIIAFNGNYKCFGKLTFIKDFNYGDEPVSETLIRELSDIKCLITKFNGYNDINYVVTSGTKKNVRYYNFINPKITKQGSTKQTFSCAVVITRLGGTIFYRKEDEVIKTYEDSDTLFAHYHEDFLKQLKDKLYESLQ